MTQLPENEERTSLLRQAQSGDPAAFQQLVGPHLGAIRRIAYSFCKDRSDADDLAQDALIKAFRAISGFEGDGGLKAWLYMIARNVCRDWLRAQKVRHRGAEVELDPEREVDDRDSQSSLLVARDEAQQLWVAIRLLDPKFRIPLVLFDIEGLSYEAIARIERIPVGTVRSRLSRARAQLAGLVSASPPSTRSQNEIRANSGTLSTSSPSDSVRLAR